VIDNPLASVPAVISVILYIFANGGIRIGKTLRKALPQYMTKHTGSAQNQDSFLSIHIAVVLYFNMLNVSMFTASDTTH
jgi:hypothetical protein